MMTPDPNSRARSTRSSQPGRRSASRPTPGPVATTTSSSSLAGSSKTRSLVTKTPLEKKKALLWRLLLGAVNVALVVVAALLIVFSEEPHKLVLVFEQRRGGGGDASMQQQFDNITESWEDLATEMAATILFAGMYTLVLGMVGLCTAVAGRDNLVVMFLCYLIVSAVLLVYATSYAFIFRDSFNQTVEVYREALANLSMEIAFDREYASMAQNTSATGFLSFDVISSCGIVAVLADALEIALCVALLGCTSAVASLVMIFNVVTGVTGVLFVLLSILIFTWSQGNQWAVVILVVAGVVCAGLSFFGFKVAEIVLHFVKAAKAEMAEQESSKKNAIPQPIERTKYSKHPKLCAFGYLGGMGCVMLLLIVNSIVAFGSADGVQNADPVAMLTHGLVVPSDDVALLLTQYFTLIALAGVLLFLVMAFNFSGSLYLFIIAFKVTRHIKQHNRDAEFKSLLRNENDGSSSSDEGADERRWHSRRRHDSGCGSSDGGDVEAQTLRAVTYAGTVEDVSTQQLLSDVLQSVSQFLRLNNPAEASKAALDLRRKAADIATSESRKMRGYLQILALKIAASSANFGDPGSAEQDLMDLVSRHYLQLQRSASMPVDFGAWKKSLLEVGDPDAAAQKLADVEASAGKGSLSARSFRSVSSTRENGGSDHEASYDNTSSDNDDMTGDEFEIVLESGSEDSDELPDSDSV